jgi:hypothetical protein
MSKQQQVMMIIFALLIRPSGCMLCSHAWCCCYSSAVQAAGNANDSLSLNDQPQLLDMRGWQMTTESTAPFLSNARDDLIQWGIMLGAGALLKLQLAM